MTTTTSGAADLPEALRSIQRFEVVDCIDDKHVPAVIPKPHGPWVRYEDHIAALAAGQATVAQAVVRHPACSPDMMVNGGALKLALNVLRRAGKNEIADELEATAQPVAEQVVAYAELPDEREAFEAMMRSQTFDSLKRLSDGSYESYEARVGWLAWIARASHGQAPANPSPPEGMEMAPKVPTVEMKAAAVKYANGTAVYKNVKAEVLRIEEDIYGEVYEAMIAAAPGPADGESK